MKRNWACDFFYAAKDIFHTDGSIAVQALVLFSDHEKLDNATAAQTLPSN